MAIDPADLPLEALIGGLPAVRTHLAVSGIRGDATARGHEDWIEVHSFGWDVSAPPPARTGSGRRRSAATLSPLRVRTVLDSSGPKLFEAATRGRSFDSAVLETSAVNGPVVLSLELVNIMISSYQLTSVGTTPVQSVELVAEKVTYTYRPVTEDGSLGEGVTHTWDVAAER